jgi:hypothetical protein
MFLKNIVVGNFNEYGSLVTFLQELYLLRSLLGNYELLLCCFDKDNFYGKF